MTEPATPAAWDAVARQCRAVAELAERVGGLLAPNEAGEAVQLVEQSRELATFAERTRDEVRAAGPLTPDALETLRAAHEALEQAEYRMRTAVADCRRGTYEALRARGLSAEEIAGAFGVGAPAVWKVLRGRRPAKSGTNDQPNGS